MQQSGCPVNHYCDKPSRHAEVLSIYPGVSCQSFLHVDTSERASRWPRRAEPRWAPGGLSVLPAPAPTATKSRSPQGFNLGNLGEQNPVGPQTGGPFFPFRPPPRRANTFKEMIASP
jgi:hypothetical protein